MLSRMPTDGQEAICSLGKSLVVCLTRSRTLSRGKGGGIEVKTIGWRHSGNDGGNSIGPGLSLTHDATNEVDTSANSKLRLASELSYAQGLYELSPSENLSLDELEQKTRNREVFANISRLAGRLVLY